MLLEKENVFVILRKRLLSRWSWIGPHEAISVAVQGDQGRATLQHHGSAADQGVGLAGRRRAEGLGRCRQTRPQQRTPAGLRAFRLVFPLYHLIVNLNCIDLFHGGNNWASDVCTKFMCPLT